MTRQCSICGTRLDTSNSLSGLSMCTSCASSSDTSNRTPCDPPSYDTPSNDTSSSYDTTPSSDS